MSDATLEEWLQRIERVHPEAVELGLDRVSAVADRLQLLPVRQSVVTVAGTNGKGSVVALLEGLFQVAGITTGTFTSPHILRFNERIHFAGREPNTVYRLSHFRNNVETYDTTKQRINKT